MNIAQSLKKLMDERSLSNSKLAREIHVHTSTVGNWLDGKDVKAENLETLCAYFGCSLDYLAGTEETKKAPTLEGEREVTDHEIKAAFFKGADMTEEEIEAAWEDVMDLRDIVIRKRKRDQGGKSPATTLPGSR